MIEMVVESVRVNLINPNRVVVLKERDRDRYLAIVIGGPEADSIAIKLQDRSAPRPLTHDLLKNVLIGLDSHVQRIVVTAIKEDTFYAVIWIQQNGRLISVDSRPSDALALALRIDCPILATDEVLQKSKGPASNSDQMPNEDLKRWLDMDDEDMGKYKM